MRGRRRSRRTRAARAAPKPGGHEHDQKASIFGAGVPPRQTPSGARPGQNDRSASL